MFIDLFDQGDTGFAVFEITAEAELDGDVYTIGVTPVQHEGEASGLARIKVFSLAGADVTDFVRKTGDTMEGALEITGYSSDDNPLIKLKPTSTRGPNSDIFKLYGTDNTAKLWITNEGDINAKGTWEPTKTNI